ncbi:hypothetical protein [Agrobacterium vitis]|uniref:hypothetical protein n=1 Tax=Agrobacterium vitis TaxID=373 RepID=UPI001267B237|nr:hypothetical protein [Agrobacterium vitis]MCM2450300.1 hypothetical protein [Agrobacterium vitis]MCM2471304.1 hypothetical protein [Agrobacterium vitis]
MVAKNQWLGLLAVLNAMAFVGAWGLTQWADQLPKDPFLAGGWMATCATAAILGSLGFAVLLTLSHKVN